MRRLCRFVSGFALGCVLCAAGGTAVSWQAAAAAGILCALAACLLRLRRKTLFLPLLGLALALFWCLGYRALVLRPVEEFCAQEQAEVCVQALDYSQPSRYGSSVPVLVKTKNVRLRAVFYYQQDVNLSPGDTISCTAKLRAATPERADERIYYASHGIWAVVSAKDALKITPCRRSVRFFPVYAAKRLKEVCRSIFPADVSGFLTALLTGDKSDLTFRLRSDLSRTGIYHVVAVSGMHVSLLAGLVLLLCGKRRVLCAALGVPVVWFFVLLTGAGASSVRAGVMQTVLLASGLVRRERDPWTAFSLALFLLLAENPWSCRNVGLLLSFSSTGGILLFTKPLYHAIVNARAYTRLEDNHPRLTRCLRPGITAVCCSLASGALSLPICAVVFEEVSVSGLLTNALCLWLVSLIFSAGLVTAIASCVWLPLGFAPGWLIAWPARAVLEIVRLLSGFPYSAASLDNPYALIWTALFYAATWLICLRPKRTQGAAALAVLAGTFAVCMGLSAADYASAGFTFTALDVGQGQCLVYTADGETSVIDCGGAEDESGELAARYLETNGVFSLERLILTHLDADHCNGAVQLLSRVRVRTLYLPQTALRQSEALLREILQTAESRGTRAVFVRSDLELPAGRGVLTILGPDLRETGNDGGLCVLASREKYDILITGDLSRNEEYRLMSAHSLREIELLVAGHHGAATSTSEALLERTGASAVVISVGKDNSYGHPAEETLSRIERAGAAVYRTDENGAIVIRGGSYGKETDGGNGRQPAAVQAGSEK